MEQFNPPRQVWSHPNPERTSMYRFMGQISTNSGSTLKTFRDLHDYSISHRSEFWRECLEFLNLVTHGSYAEVVDEAQSIDAMPRWFGGLQLNFAENMLFGSQGAERGGLPTRNKKDDDVAVIEVREGPSEAVRYTWERVRRDVGTLAASMKATGIRKGDRVMAIASNSYSTLCVMLAITWLGGIFSSVSTDTGVQGILARTLRIKPKLVFMEDGAVFNGTTLDLQKKMTEVLETLVEIPEFKKLISIPRFPSTSALPTRSEVESWEVFVSRASEQTWPAFEKLAFNEPMLISFSSGTTGPPKGIVHSVGGLLLNGAKEAILHEDITPKDVVLQYTTTSWIMHLAAIMPLLAGAQTVLYDGSPFYPDPVAFVRLIGELKVTKLGTSPGWMQRLRSNSVVPRTVTDLSHLRLVTSTGMVLQDDLFEWFYDVAFPRHTQLFNMSGGTDIAGCFALGNPLSPVYVGGCQGPSLGMAVAAMDQDSPPEADIPVADGAMGELVATVSFPNVPVCFWGDLPPSSPQSKFFDSYFARFNHKWTQGDLVSINPVTRGIVFHGRADGVLNPSGVRFGSAEIYGLIERRFAGEISDSLCVGKRGKGDKNESVMLFLLMEPGKRFTESLVRAVKAAIKEDLSPRHVPAHVFETPEIPKTLNLKKVEVPVKRILSGERVKPSPTLLNPQSLEFFYQFANLGESHIKPRL